jgi:hypothetical protein
MRKTLITMMALAAFAMLLVVPAQAQMKTEFGLKGAVNMANMSGDVENNKMMLAFGGGIFARIMPNDQICIQPEVLYMMKGCKFDDVGTTTDAKTVFNYIEVPVLVKYMIPTEGKISPCIFAGPAVGMLMSAKAKGTQDNTDYDNDIKDFMKSIDFGVAFGAGIDFAVGEKGKITFDARYTLGLNNLNDVSEADAATFGFGVDDSFKNGVISVMVGYAFPIGQSEGM